MKKVFCSVCLSHHDGPCHVSSVECLCGSEYYDPQIFAEHYLSCTAVSDVPATTSVLDFAITELTELELLAKNHVVIGKQLGSVTLITLSATFQARLTEIISRLKQIQNEPKPG